MKLPDIIRQMNLLRM